MKVVVFIDLIATMILPASYCYAMYLLFLVFMEDLPVSKILLILYGIIMGVQVVVFILRSRWEYVWWFAIYFIVGLPVFYLILPVYSFWNMDDFSWGKTRAVGGSAAANNASTYVDEDDETESLVKEGEVDDDGSTSSSSRTNSDGYEDEDSDDRSDSQDHSDDETEEEDDDDASNNSEDSESEVESQDDSRASRMQEQRSHRSRTFL
jgi:chitin synthase